MAPFDVFTWIVLAMFLLGGYRTGLIQSVGGVVGLLLAAIITPRLAGPFGEVLAPVFGGNDVFGEIAAFIILFLLISRLVALAFVFVNKAFNMVAILPGMKLMNRLGGGLFGLIEGSLFIGILLQYVTRLPLGPGLTDFIDSSTMAPIMLGIAAWLVGLFPKALRETERVIDSVASRA